MGGVSVVATEVASASFILLSPVTRLTDPSVRNAKPLPQRIRDVITGDAVESLAIACHKLRGIAASVLAGRADALSDDDDVDDKPGSRAAILQWSAIEAELRTALKPPSRTSTPPL